MSTLRDEIWEWLCSWINNRDWRDEGPLTVRELEHLWSVDHDIDIGRDTMIGGQDDACDY